MPQTFTDSSGNTRTEYHEVKVEASTSTVEYAVPSIGYIVLPNTVQIIPDVLEVGSKLKIKPDGTVYANTINVEDTFTAKYGNIGGFHFENNILQSKALTLTNSSVSIPLFKTLVIGKDDLPEKGLTIVSNSRYTKKNVREENLNIIKTNDILTLSAGESTEAAQKAIIQLNSLKESVENSKTATINISITGKVSTSTTSTSTNSPTSTFIAIDSLNKNNHFFVNDGIGGGGGTLTKYTTTVTLTATATLENLVNQEALEKDCEFSVPIAIKIGTYWINRTIHFNFAKDTTTRKDDENKRQTKTLTVSEYSYSNLPQYYGIAARSSGTPVKNYTTTSSMTWTSDTQEYSPKINMNGDVDISGNARVDGDVDISGNARVDGSIGVYGAVVVNNSVSVNGAVDISGAVSVNGTTVHYSDIQLKTNVTNIYENLQLNNFYKQLTPVSFSWKQQPNKSHFGFIAQNIKAAADSTRGNSNYIVNKSNNSEYYSVDYNGMIALNAAQIKDLLNRVEYLEAQLKEYKEAKSIIEGSTNENK